MISGISTRVARIRSAWASVRREIRSPPCGLGRGPRRSDKPSHLWPAVSLWRGAYDRGDGISWCLWHHERGGLLDGVAHEDANADAFSPRDRFNVRTRGGARHPHGRRSQRGSRRTEQPTRGIFSVPLGAVWPTLLAGAPLLQALWILPAVLSTLLWVRIRLLTTGRSGLQASAGSGSNSDPLSN